MTVSFATKELEMPIPVTSKNWENTRHIYTNVYEDTDPSIALAITNIYGVLSSYYSLDSKPGLRKIITDQIDPPFSSWLSEMGYKPKSFVLYLENNLELDSEIDYSS
jgi:hypothetical protein